MDKNLLEKAYRKLKSQIYYDNSMLYLKEQIATFESMGVESQLQELLVEFINEKDLLFDEITKGIDVACYPKTFQKCDADIVTNSVERAESYNIDKVSYFIKMPIKAHILGVAWILLAGKYIDQNLYKHTYGNRLRDAFDEGLEKISNTPYLFKPYFKSYETWRDQAIDRAQSKLNKGDDVFVVSLDLASYYYSTNVDFSRLNEDVESAIKDGETCSNKVINDLNQLIELIFKTYSKKFDFSIGDRTIIPIGFLPSNIIANWYLSDFDQQIVHELKPIYYGRYVDDMIIVINASSYTNRKGKFTISDVIDDLFTESGFSKKNILKNNKNQKNDVYTLADKKYHGLKIQNSKIRLFHLVSTGSQAILDNFKSEIKKVSSEFRFLQEEGALNSNFEESVYKLNYEDTINKFRGVTGIDIDKFELSKYLAKINFITKSDDMTKNEVTSKNILKAFAGSNSIKFYSFWEKVFTYYLLQGDWESFINFYIKVAESLDKITFSHKYEVNENDGMFSTNSTQVVDYYLKDRSENDRIINILKVRLYLSMTLTIALKWNEQSQNAIKKLLKEFLFLDLKNNQYLELGLDSNLKTYFKHKNVELDLDTVIINKLHLTVSNFINANLINHQMVKTPLSNYTKCIVEDKTYNLTKFSNPCKKNDCDKDLECFDEMRGRYNPRFVHIHEAFLFYYSHKALNGQTIEGADHFEQVFKDIFLKINYPNFVYDKYKTNIVDTNCYYEVKAHDKCGEYRVNNIFVGNEKYDKVKIAVGNVRVNSKDIEDSIRGINTMHPRRLQELSIIIINEAARQNVKILVLPECYVPFQWMQIIAEQSRKHGILIIVGLEHVISNTSGRKAFNYIATFLPYQVGGLQYVIPKLRLKNAYSPAEVKLIRGYGYDPVEGSEFDIFEWNGVRIAPYYCFEIADIKARGIFRSEVDIITISEYNKDVNYFSNIVESLSRDVHCICVQANTSQYGDSRIVQPSRTETMNILRVKGGENQFIMSAEVDIKALREFQVVDYNMQEEKKDMFKQTPPKFERDKVRRVLRYQ
jgi:hypothetical protein